MSYKETGYLAGKEIDSVIATLTFQINRNQARTLYKFYKQIRFQRDSSVLITFKCCYRFNYKLSF